MKLSLWQQFSSNHSADFMIIGKFESQERANAAADEIRTMLTEISQWWGQYETAEAWEKAEAEIRVQSGLTPPERKYQQQYGIEMWSKGRDSFLDWLQSVHAPEAVNVYENLVILNQSELPLDTWAGPAPFDEITQKLGGEIAIDAEWPELYFLTDISADAPDEETAQKILAETRRWENPSGARIMKLAGLYPTNGTISLDGCHISLIQYKFHASFYIHPPKAYGEKYENGKLIRYVEITKSVKSNFQEEFARVMQYLRSRGCMNIRYEFVQHSG